MAAVKGPNGLVIPMSDDMAKALTKQGDEFQVVKDEPKATKPAAKSESTSKSTK